MRPATLLLLAAATLLPARAQQLTVPLWPSSPGTSSNAPEHNATEPSDPLIAGRPIVKLANVSQPTLTVYRVAPASGSSPAPAVLVFPGGGYSILALDLEGTEVCEWLTRAGYACVLVKYRVPNSGPYPRSTAALADAQRAISLTRLNAAAWGIDPNHVGVLGFSAGAHLAAALSTHFTTRVYAPADPADAQPLRPDFALVLYPGYLALPSPNTPGQPYTPNPDIPIPHDAPPTFLLQAEDDPVHVENAVTYFLQLKQAGVPAELHIFAQGGHGYGLRANGLPVTGWPALAEQWLRSIHAAPHFREDPATPSR